MKNTIAIIILCFLPVLVGLLFLGTNPKVGEVLLIVAGCVECLIVLMRERTKENENKKNYGRYYSRPDDEGYQDYQTIKKTLIIAALVSFVLAVLWFFLFRG